VTKHTLNLIKGRKDTMRMHFSPGGLFTFLRLTDGNLKIDLKLAV